MIAKQEYESAVAESLQMLDRAGIVLTPAEKARFEVADFGLNELRKTGLQIITYVNTERCCAKEIVMFPTISLPLGNCLPVPQRSGVEAACLQAADRV